MYWGVENRDVSGGHSFMNSHTLSEANNQNSIDYTKKRDGNVPNISEMEDTGLQDGVDIDVMIPASTLHQYANMEYNNDSHFPFMNGKRSTSNNSSVSTLTPPSVTSIKDEVFSLQNPIHEKIKYLD